jgi:hypothetical protein
MGNTGDGGGAIRIDATGQVTLDGTLNANGMNAISTHGGGGSGGSILINCLTFTGNGRLWVRGGNGNNSGGAGGGGRIAVLYVPAAQAGMGPVNVAFNAAAGTGGANDCTAEPGTLYFPDTALISSFMGTTWAGGNLYIPGFTAWSEDSLQIAGQFGLPQVTNLVVTNNLSILAGGALTLYSVPTNDATPPDGFRLDVGGDLSVAGTLILGSDSTNGASPRVTCRNLAVAATGKIDADYRGFAVQTGPGAVGRGAGHGGMGSCGGSAYSARGPTYGDPLYPIAPGSGTGDAAYPNISGYGGGAIRLHVAETATIHGVISANGQPSITTHGNAGSGGSILLICRVFQGSSTGMLQARGGNGDNTGGAAGGGRIAVLYNPADQAALPSPNPGVRFSAAPGSSGNNDFLAETGTLYLPDAESLFLSSHMTVQWQNVDLVIPGGFPHWSLPSLQLDGKFRIPGLQTLRVAGDLTLGSSGRLALYSQPSNTVEHEIGIRLDVGGTLTVPSGGEILLVSDLDTGGVPYIECGSFNLQAGGLVRADYRGFHIGQGPGRGINYGGGGYGGAGSRGNTASAHGGPTNGVAHAPILAGSGAGTYGTGGGRGGGSVRISARGAMIVNGTIQANGMMRIVTHAGGGSGGGILLTARSVSGTGNLQARGGDSSNNGGAGGGGRIAIWTSFLPPGTLRRLAGQPLPDRVTVLDPAILWPGLTLSVAAGTGGTNPGEAQPGTIFAGCLEAGTFVTIR